MSKLLRDKGAFSGKKATADVAIDQIIAKTIEVTDISRATGATPSSA